MNEPENEEIDVSPRSKPEAITAIDAAALTNVFTRVQEILAAREGQDDTADSVTVRANRQGKVDALNLAEIAGGLKEFKLSIAQQGDAVWWITESGAMGCFIVSLPYVRRGDKASDLETGSGVLYIDRADSNSMKGESKRKSETGEGSIVGASVGGMLKKDAIVKGLPLEYRIKQEGQEISKSVTTTRVQNMGIIRIVGHTK